MVVICAAVKLLRPFVEFVRHGKMHFNSIRPVSISVCMKCKNININKCLCVSCATTFSNYYTAKSVRNNQQRNVWVTSEREWERDEEERLVWRHIKPNRQLMRAQKGATTSTCWHTSKVQVARYLFFDTSSSTFLDSIMEKKLKVFDRAKVFKHHKSLVLSRSLSHTFRETPRARMCLFQFWPHQKMWWRFVFACEKWKCSRCNPQWKGRRLQS